ncbi:MAG: branched-chain amino acid aminotransferase [Rickettsiales bacterium]
MDAPFDDRDGFIWVNGAMQPWREAKIHVLTHGLHYGSAVFEGLRVYDGKIFKATEHSERLKKSAELIGFTLDYSVDAINGAMDDVVKAQGITNGYVRPVSWLGSERMKIHAEGCKPNLAIAAWEWPAYFDPDKAAKGLRLCWADWRRPSPETAPTASKAAGLYMICTMSKKTAVDKGYDDALMKDYRGYVAEATGANVFFVMPDGSLHTPIADCFLNGITRQTVIVLAKNLGINVVERHISPEEIGGAREAFLTGTAAEITPVGEIAGHTYVPGAVTETVTHAYRAETHR